MNTVNTKGVMGKGIALQFKRAFPANFKAYRAACAAERVRLGEMFVTDTGRLANPRLIINFPTKGHWKSRSRLSDIEPGLDDLRRVLVEREVRSVAIPPLGCGLGGLNWSDVRPLIERALSDLQTRGRWGMRVLQLGGMARAYNDMNPVHRRSVYYLRHQSDDADYGPIHEPPNLQGIRRLKRAWWAMRRATMGYPSITERTKRRQSDMLDRLRDRLHEIAAQQRTRSQGSDDPPLHD